MRLKDLISVCGEYVNVQIEDRNSMDIIATYDCNDRELSENFYNAMEEYDNYEWGKDFDFTIETNWVYVYVEVR